MRSRSAGVVFFGRPPPVVRVKRRETLLVEGVDHLAHVRLVGLHQCRDSGADIRFVEANTIIARWRCDWYFARLEIDFSRAPSCGPSSRTNTSGGRIATSRVEDMHPHSPPNPELPVKRLPTIHRV